MYMQINNPMELFPGMQAELIGETPLVVMRRQSILAWSEVDGKRVSNFQLEVLDAIGTMYPDMTWHPTDGDRVLVHTDEHGHWLIEPNGTYQWEIPNGPVIRVGAGEEHPFMTQADVSRCPHLIMVPEHYREDGTCRCNDETHTEMQAWGYRWNAETKHWS